MMTIGDYRVERQLGSGAFGCTFLATYLKLGLPACIKVEATGQEPYQSLFREEARLLWGMHHVSLPTMKAYEESPEGQCIVMSYVAGEHLEEHCTQHGAIADEHICWMLQRMLDALSYLHHERKIIHGDVKPVNCILDLPNHNVTLVDFGLCVQNPTAVSHAKGGTAQYLAPELALGRPPIPASDLYAVGKTAVRLAGGNVATGALPHDMRPELRDCIAAMLRHDPLARPQDARELLLAITELRKKCWNRTSTREMIAYR
ncbi:serine/threonine protein kinase [Candidatus Uhrbacteria bacterium]|nr:serine/threonine protein kinase [Candidatus Uhrbacteria bacterium]